MNLIKKIKCQFKRCIEPNDINKNQLEELVKQGCILIDVRSKQEFEEGHLDNAICIPEYEIKKEIINIVNDKNKKIVLYCDTGSRSKKAEKILQKIGYKNVYNLYKGQFGEE